MGRGPKPAKSKEAKPPAVRKPLNDAEPRVRDLEKRLAAALEREADAQARETATAEILRVIASSPNDVQPVFDTIAENANSLLRGWGALVVRFDGELLHVAGLRAGPGASEESIRKRFPQPASQDTFSGAVVRDPAVKQIADVETDDDWISLREHARRQGWRANLGVPMLHDGQPIGAITVTRREPGAFSAHEVDLLKTFADQAVIAIENVRLFNETKEALERQTATSEILRVISRSPTDVQPVFDTIVQNAGRVCDSMDAALVLADGAEMVVAAHWGPIAGPPGTRFALTGEQVMGRAILEAKAVHVEDLSVRPDFPEGRALAIQMGHRTTLAVPLLRESRAIGSLLIRRTEVRPFSDKQIELLQTFADQAVIAIENVRLFTETKEALERQTATAEILRVISQSQTDVQPVFEAICRSAVRLLGTFTGAIIRFDGQLMHLGAVISSSAEADERYRQLFPRPPDREMMIGRAILDRTVVHVADVEKAESAITRQTGRDFGYHRVLIVPMLREGAAIGTLNVTGREPGFYSERQVELLKIFAEQAVIAIENVRLFNETKEALERETATGEILRVISTSPTDIQPVLDAVAESAARLTSTLDVGIFLRDGDGLRLAAHHGPIPARSTVPLIREEVTGRAVLDGRTIHVADYQSETVEFPRGSENARRLGLRTILSVPLVREGGIALGTINLRRAKVLLFTDRQVVLLQTFADQAVIAIENVRLFKELEASNRELTTALDKQTATSDILRVISGSRTDVQPVFDAILQSAVRLLGGYSSTVTRVVGDQIEIAALTSTDATGDAAQRARYPQSLSSGGSHATAIRNRTPFNIADTQTDLGLPEPVRTFARVRGYRGLVVVPLLRHDVAIGAISVTRREPGGFNDDEIVLLQTFADQAVIAIENVRLFTELEERNRDLTATSEVLRVISRSPTDAQPVFEAIVDSAARLTGAQIAAAFRFDGELIHYLAGFSPIHGVEEEYRGIFPRPLVPGAPQTRAIRQRRIVQIPDVERDENIPAAVRERIRSTGIRSLLQVPMIRDDAAIGLIAVGRTEPIPFTEQQVALLQTFADQAVIAIENVRLFKELESKNVNLTEALAQQTATADILRVISSSPTEIQPTFEAIAAAAMTLCEADTAALFQFDGVLIHFVAQHGRTSEEVDAARRVFPQRPRRHSVTGRAILASAIVQIADVSQDRELEEALRVFRTMLSVPLMRDGRALGAITLARRIVKAFTEQQITLLRTFADQAVIAIENVRLFTELQARTRELTRSVEQLTALGEVGQAITSTLDLQAVLSTIVARATQLTGVDAGIIYEYDEVHEAFEPRATERLEEDIVRMLEATPIRKGQGATGRLAEVAEPIQVADLRDITVHILARDALVGAGYRAVLAVPLIREDHLIGGLTVFRKTPGEFAPDVIDLLRTFATQSALAIQNARLFRELADKSRELEAASQHKSEFLANMSHELRTPLNAIIGFSEVLTDRMFGELNEKQEEYSKDIHASGQHLLSLINDILDLSKIEAGRMELELTEFDLPNTIENALMLVRERAGRRSIALHTDIDTRLGQIQADERKIRQVVLNLLSNAIKFTPEGGRIDVGAVPKDGFVEVSVSDTGIGIAPEDQEKVFEEFRQVGTAAKKVEGTGLGLTLCRKFVELHGGRIWVKSELGAGSTFTFTIPLRPGESGSTR